jgi:hypothetical protein
VEHATQQNPLVRLVVGKVRGARENHVPDRIPPKGKHLTSDRGGVPATAGRRRSPELVDELGQIPDLRR